MRLLPTLLALAALALPALSTPTPTTNPPTPAKRAPASCSAASLTKFKFFGVNQSGAEFGQQNIPGRLGTDYTWPSPSSIDVSVLCLMGDWQ